MGIDYRTEQAVSFFYDEDPDRFGQSYAPHLSYALEDCAICWGNAR